MPTVGVLGASGFVGAAVTGALRERGVEVLAVSAPRLRITVAGLRESGWSPAADRAVTDLAGELRGTDVVVNAAGLATASAAAGAALWGANALLPQVVARASTRAGARRLIHISSAAVQGNRTLDESENLAPFSPYSQSKAVGEALLRRITELPIVRVRPTSVHGAGRQVTATLVRLARSGWATVAAPGDAPTPQVLVQNVAALVAAVCEESAQPPAVVLQPWEGHTTASFLALLGGRDPRLLPSPLSAFARRAARVATAGGQGLAAQGRRAELLLFGQRQSPGWAEATGFRSPYGDRDWHELVRST